MNHFKSFTDAELIALLLRDVQQYSVIIHSITSAENSAVREMYEIELFNMLSQSPIELVSLNPMQIS